MKDWKVKDVMTTDVVSVGLDTAYREIVDLLAQHRIGGVPVVDEFGRVLGVVSEVDLLHKVDFTPRPFEWGKHRKARDKAAGAFAEQLMTAPAITVLPGSRVVDAAKLMARKDIKRLPVTDELGRLSGMVCRTDLLKIYLRPDDELRAEIAGEVLRNTLQIDLSQVDVQVRDGVVTLGGHVDRKSTTEIALRVVAAVPGVVRVIDQLAWKTDDTVPAGFIHY